MLPSTVQEKQDVEEYYLSQSSGASVTFLQKVYSEVIAGHKHDVWDVHASDGRWWVIINPTNLYSQTQFPNLDYAVTFHMGLCLRIPRTDEQRLSDCPITPFSAVMNQLQELPNFLSQAKGLADYQSMGVKSREVLLSFVGMAQDLVQWPVETPPQRANFRSWVDVIFNTVLAGDTQKERRHLFKTMFNEAWTFSNWLTHTKSATWLDAEAAQTSTDHAIGFGVSILLRFVRLVPEQCPECGSPDLSPQESRPEELPDTLWQRPICETCGWTGIPVRSDPESPKLEIITREGGENTGECIIPNVPLTKLAKPRAEN